jgi:hypothetical protein
MRHRLADERGIALVMAMGVLIVLTISVLAVLTYTSSNTRSVRFGNARQASSGVAEAGLNEAISIISNAADVRDPSALPSGGDTFDGGSSASWSGTVSGDTWTVSSTSTVKNPSGAADLHRTVSSQFRVGVDGVGLAPAWQFTYTDDTTTCMTISQSAAIAAPFYIAGDMCLQNSANPTTPELTVKGHITLQNTSKIGSSAVHIAKLHTSGCSTSTSGPWTLANCDAAHGVYADSVDSIFPNVSKPTVDIPYWYAYSKPGPKNNCTSGSIPGGFDTNTTLDHSRSTFTLLPSSSYSCTFTSGSSTLGKLIWTPGSPGTLQVSGVLFFDGNIQIAGQAVYTGRATIYTSGTVTFSGTDYLCGAANCDSSAWDGDNNMITFVAGSCSAYTNQVCTTTVNDGFSTANSAKFQGGVYAVTDVRQANSALIEGPTISRQLYLLQSSTAQKWPSIDFVSYGAPAPIGSTKLIPITGTWSG